VIPLCLQRKDSVKKSDIIKIEKAMCGKLFNFNAFLSDKNNIVNNISNPNIPSSENI
jgi:hypothetical protein